MRQFLAATSHSKQLFGPAGQHGFTDLLDMATKYACEHFEEILASGKEQFLSLPFGELKEIISNDYLGVTNEEVVLSAVIQWAHHDLEARAALFPDILSLVRLPFVSSQFLNHVAKEVLVQNDQCQFYIDEAHKYKAWPNRRWELRHSCRILPRKPSSLRNSILFPICGPIHFVEQYDVDTDTLTALGQSNISINLRGFCVIAYNGYLYVIGGYDRGSYSNSVDRYHLKEKVWSASRPMVHPRM